MGARSANPSDYVYFILGRNPLIEPNNVRVLAGVENESTGTLGAGRHKSPAPGTVAFFRSQSAPCLLSTSLSLYVSPTKLHTFRFSLTLSAFRGLLPSHIISRSVRGRADFLPPVQGNALAVIFQAGGIFFGVAERAGRSPTVPSTTWPLFFSARAAFRAIIRADRSINTHGQAAIASLFVETDKKRM